MSNYRTYYGKLIYDDMGDYIVDNFNLSKALWEIYYHPNNHIDITIMAGCKTIFHEDGNLYRRKSDSVDLYCWHINGNDLETVLFNSTDSDIEITLFAEALEGVDYDTIESKY